ncbi:uncharacterized [Tachysurus ichikawai]
MSHLYLHHTLQLRVNEAKNAFSRQTAVKTVLQMSGTPQCNSQLCPDRNQTHHRGVPFRAVIKSAIDGQAGRVSGPIFLQCEDC